MIPRGTLHIRSAELFRSLVESCRRNRPGSVEEAISCLEIPSVRQDFFGANHTAVVGLSLRTLWDSYLATSGWQPGDEVLMSAVTLPDMATIVRAHGLIPVPLNVSRQSLEISPEELGERITAKTRGVLIAQLFGARNDLSKIAQICRQHKIVLCEDVAQGYCADGNWLPQTVDVAFYSFGPIKTQTALGGGLAILRDTVHAAAMNLQLLNHPQVAGSRWMRRVLRSLLLNTLSGHLPFSIVANLAVLRGGNLDQWLQSQLKSFPAGQLLESLRFRPADSALRLLSRQIQAPPDSWLLQRTQLAIHVQQALPKSMRVGDLANYPSRWVLPAVSINKQSLCQTLRSHGFDATCYASNLRLIQEAESSFTHEKATSENSTAFNLSSTRDWVDRIVYLPLHPAMSITTATKLGQLAGQLEATLTPPSD